MVFWRRFLIPVNDAIKLTHDLLCSDDTHTPIPPKKTLSEDDSLTEALAMGSPILPVIANIYIENLKQRALGTSSLLPGFGKDMLMTLSGHAI